VEEALAFAPQIAVIASPAPFHINAAKSLADAGVHLLIEKPLSDLSEGVSQLLELCKKQNIVLQVGYNLRFLASLKHFRSMLMGGAIGKVISVRSEAGQFLPSWRPLSDYRNSVSAKKELGGGVLLEFSHEIDYLRWIFGEIEWVRAFLGRQSDLEIDVEDTAHLTLGFGLPENGFQLCGTLNLDFIRHDTIRQCIAIGERGSLRWNALAGTVELYEMSGSEWRQIFKQQQRDDSYLDEWENFIDAVKKNNPPLVSGEDGLKVLRIIEAAKESAQYGGKIAKVSYLHTTG
jgi:predicted dehydrogenase